MENVRNLVGNRVTLHQRTGLGFDSQPLAIASPSGAIANLFPRMWESCDVEILFVEREIADQAGIGVVSSPEHQSPSRSFIRIHEERH